MNSMLTIVFILLAAHPGNFFFCPLQNGVAAADDGISPYLQYYNPTSRLRRGSRSSKEVAEEQMISEETVIEEEELLSNPRRMLQQQQQQDTSTNNSPFTDSSSIIFHNEQINNPLESNRDELINMTEALAMKLTDNPSFKPTVTSTPPPSIPTTYPTFSPTTYIDKFNNPNYSPNSNSSPYSQDDTDFREFIAFVGWYAFLICCCLLPTACAYYRRRRSATELRENLEGIQGRLREIERRRREEDGGVDGESGLIGERRDQEWGILEEMFADSPTNNNPNSPTSDQRRRMILSDIMGSSASPIARVLDYMERESRRKRERGQRLVAALKECSLRVEERHLIEKKEDERDVENDIVVGGDIELGKLSDGKEKGNSKDDMAVASEEISETIASKQSDANRSSEPPASPNAENNNNDPQTVSTAGNDVSPSSVDVAVPSIAPQSFYQVDDPYEDDDDDDNKYTALCIPCSDVTAASTNTPQSPPPTQTTNTRLVSPTCIICLLQYTPGCYVTWSSNKECTHVFHRDCILMWLLKKENDTAGDVESGDGTTGALCPCCRREFVLEGVLNGDADDERNGQSEVAAAVDARNDSSIQGGGSGEEAASATGLHLSNRDWTRNISLEPVQTPQQQPTPPPGVSRYTNFPGSFSIG